MIRLRWHALMIAAAIMSSPIVQAHGNLLSEEQKTRLISVLGQRLQDHYVDPLMGKTMQAALARKNSDDGYASITTDTDLASVLTADLRRASADRHLRVFASHQPAPPEAGKGEPSAQQQSLMIEQLKADNFGVGVVQKLPGDIGYIELRRFVPLRFAREVFSDAMNKLTDSKALIIDLRRNGGGDPASVSYISSYLFEKRTHLNDLEWRRGNKVDSFWTFESVPGKRLSPEAPVFVLTSRGTFSAAEEFSYNLQQLKRATIVGEVTGGGANPGEEMSLGGGFYAFIPTGRARNPISKTNWEGKGVKPEVAVPAPEAFLEAQRLALATLLSLQPNHALNAALRSRLGELTHQKARSTNWFAQQPIYLRGSMNNWDATARMNQAGATRFQTELALDKGMYEFKIASADFSTVDLGGADVGMAPGQGVATVLVEGGENVRLHAVSAGTYRFVLDVADPYRPALTFSRNPIESNPLVTGRDEVATRQAN